MPDLKGLKPGDPIMVPKGWRGGEYEERTVSKVGRLWISVGEDWSARRFRILNGTEEDNHGRAAMTVSAYEERAARGEVIATLTKKGVETYRGWSERLTLDQLRRILAILEE